MFASNAAYGNQTAYGHLSPNDVPQLKPGTRIIDVREPHEYTDELGHIAGSQLVPLATVASASKSWSKQELLVVVCRSGGRSSRACEYLSGAGFTNVKNVDGGMLAYARAGLPVERRIIWPHSR